MLSTLLPWSHSRQRTSLLICRLRVRRFSWTPADLKEADHIVALKADEHLPLLEERFPDWFNDTNQSRVEFWHIHDTDLASPDIALPLIRSNVLSLMHRLSGRPFRLSGS